MRVLLVSGSTRNGSANTAALAAAAELAPAGVTPGKNLLDWTVGGGEMNEKPAAWINVANPGRCGGATATLDSVS
jgi:NAD(P)H-dependent FMN reductase